MFGYVRPFKPQLRVCEFDTYKAVYCGLCHQLGKTFGPFARLTLNYDFTFLALLAAGLSPESVGFKKSVCAANPLRRKTCLRACSGLRYSASVAMMMLYHKVCDNIADGGFFGKLAGLAVKPAVAPARRRARKLYPETDAAITAAMQKQAALERAQESVIDRAADPTGNALAAVFSALAPNPTQARVLERFGYLLGRWIYLIDAFDDLEDDLKHRRYNPFGYKYDLYRAAPDRLDAVKAEAVQALNLTVTELAAAYELLELHRYKSILDNIVYLGFLHTQETILNKAKENTQK